jgi:hypothetical protein
MGGAADRSMTSLSWLVVTPAEINPLHHHLQRIIFLKVSCQFQSEI